MPIVKIEKRVLDFDEILAYDPGGTTGFARITIDRARERVRISEIGEFTTWGKIDKHLEAIKDKEKTCVVYEGFNTRAPFANIVLEHVNLPMEVIGVIKYLCVRNEVLMFEQQPFERGIIAKVNPKTHKLEGWYKEIHHDFPSHYGSAVRHGIFFAVKKVLGLKPWKLEYDLEKLKSVFA